MMKYIYFPLILLLYSCSPPSYIYLFNNTGSDLNVSYEKNSNHVKDSVMLKGTALKLKVGALYGVKVVLSDDSTQWGYKLIKPVGPFALGESVSYYFDYEGISPFLKITYKFQIERDKKIFALKNSEKFPLNINEKTVQPDGYPIEPILVK